MHSHRVHVLDGADDDEIILGVAHHLELVLLPADDGFLQEHALDRRRLERRADLGAQLLLVVGDAAARPAQGEGSAHDDGESQLAARFSQLAHVGDHAASGKVQPRRLHGLLEELAVLRLLDRGKRGPDQLDAVFFKDAALGERRRQVQRRLPAQGREQGLRPLAREDQLQELRRQRLDVGAVRLRGVRHDRRRIRVDEDDGVALFAQSLDPLNPRVIKLARLPDDDRPRPHD